MEAMELASEGACVVVVDVLSFTTAVTVAVEHGSAVFPYPWRDESARGFAAQHDAELAVGRRMVDTDNPWSLSPAALLAAPKVARLVLPSPNGSSIAASVRQGTVVAGCLRNATAVGKWIGGNGYGQPGRPVVVIAAGEKWGDGSLRPCLEDLLGAGAVLAALPVDDAHWSPEARAARAAFAGSTDVVRAVRDCGSGVELSRQGFASDVDVAVELAASTVVPVLTDGAFRAERPLRPRRRAGQRCGAGRGALRSWRRAPRRDHGVVLDDGPPSGRYGSDSGTAVWCST